MIIKPQCGDQITTVGENHGYDRTNNAVRAMHIPLSGHRSAVVGCWGIICSVGDDDAVGLLIRGVSPVPWVTHAFHPRL